MAVEVLVQAMEELVDQAEVLEVLMVLVLLEVLHLLQLKVLLVVILVTALVVRGMVLAVEVLVRLGFQQQRLEWLQQEERV